MTIRVVKPGFFTTVQDRGRYGYAHLGISPAGAADALSLRIANLLVGNDENAPALEMTLLGATLEFEERSYRRHLRRQLRLQVGPESRHARYEAVEVAAGSVLQCGSTTDGARIATWRSREDSTFRSSWAAPQPIFVAASAASRDAGCRAAMCCASQSRRFAATAAARGTLWKRCSATVQFG